MAFVSTRTHDSVMGENNARSIAAPPPPPQAQPDSPNYNDVTPPASGSAQSFSSSPRQYSSELPGSILEEGGEFSGSESPIEPVTPVSNRYSQEFVNADSHKFLHHHQHQLTAGTPPLPHHASLGSEPQPIQPESGAPKSAPSAQKATLLSTSPLQRNQSATTVTPSTGSASAEQQQQTLTTAKRRSTRGSTSSFKRTFSNLFRRTNSNQNHNNSPFDAAEPLPTGEIRTNSVSQSPHNTRSNSPPSPESPPLEMAATTRTQNTEMPGPDDFMKKKGRATSNLTLRGRNINFVSSNRGGRGSKTNHLRRASSFNSGQAPAPRDSNTDNIQDGHFPPERVPWALIPEAGTGAKSRRLSLSLPDDFTVDVADLMSEYEYQHKFLGRHGKHLGKGAASKVALMVRKGCPTELYAAKEFRGKSKAETEDEYAKKVKSEYSIAKSLHHPNIVETVRLCTDHGRWNHVMEYCSEGDMYSLVVKGHLKGDDGKKDRLCLFKQIIQGVAYLHANGIAHRDIKLENMLITKDSKVKITDFGVSEVFSGTHPGLRESGGQCGQNMGDIRLCSPGICGSEPYIAPEVLAKKNMYDPRALDVWGTGIIMIYMTFGGNIWAKAERGNPHYDKLVDGWDKWNRKNPEPDATISEDNYPHCLPFDLMVSPPALRRVLLQMLNPDPNKRATIQDVVNNRWIKGIECCQLDTYDDPALLIDASKKDGRNPTKIFCHNHLPPKAIGSHSLGKMPGSAGY